MKGSVKKRGKTWRYRVDIGRNPITGERQQISKGGFKTKKECETELAKVQTQYHEGTYVNESEILLKDFVPKWLEMYEKSPNVKISSVRVRKHETQNLAKYFKEAKLKDVTDTMYQKFLLDMSDKFAKNTVSGIHTACRMLFKRAVKLKYIKNNPTEDAEIPEQEETVEELENKKELPKFFERKELVEFLNLCKEDFRHQTYIIFLLLSNTGMRVGELCALKWKDIDFVNKTIRIYKTYYNPNNNTVKYDLLTPKTKTSIRTIYIDDLLISELKKHKAWQNELKLKFKDWHDDFVITKFLKYPGYPETVKQIEFIMDQIVTKNNLKDLTPHSLRHTHTSLLAMAGVSLEEIMERLGHRDDDITRNIYLHVTEEIKKEAPQKFLKLMRDF